MWSGVSWEVKVVLIELFVVFMGKRWLRYGLVGNFLVYGIGWGALAYISTHTDMQLGSSTTSVRTKAPKWTKTWPRKCSPSPTPNSRKVPSKPRRTSS